MSGYWQPQQSGYGPPMGYPPPPARRGMPTWLIVLLILFVIGAVLVVLMCAGCLYLASQAPMTAAVPGSRVPQKYVDQIRRLGLIEDGESIKFFYSDGFLDIEEGMYFFTDRAVVIYSTTMSSSDPLTRIEFADILDITHDDTDNFWFDSSIWIETEDSYFTMPVSNESGGDEKFFELLRQTWEQQRSSAPN